MSFNPRAREERDTILSNSLFPNRKPNPFREPLTANNPNAKHRYRLRCPKTEIY